MARMPRVVETVQTHFHNVMDILLFGVTPTLGIETLSSITTKLIPRNATTPFASRPHRQHSCKGQGYEQGPVNDQDKARRDIIEESI
ncbi:hypothetical protein EDB85DRAFT_2145337 [Lactarius pseudohatsudake]|nr:hypothetical protein EDB85DRAFT_2145337 [Lactarius pseudohatsudake]